jgi:hypothetical protein
MASKRTAPGAGRVPQHPDALAQAAELETYRTELESQNR